MAMIDRFAVASKGQITTDQLETLISHVHETPAPLRSLLYREEVPRKEVSAVIDLISSPGGQPLCDHAAEAVAEALLRVLLEGPPLLGTELYNKFTRISFSSPSHELTSAGPGDGGVVTHLRSLVEGLPDESRGLLQKLILCLCRLSDNEDGVDLQAPPACPWALAARLYAW